jgi:hypothetical protein
LQTGFYFVAVVMVMVMDWVQRGNSGAGGDMLLRSLPFLASSMYMLFV